MLAVTDIERLIDALPVTFFSEALKEGYRGLLSDPRFDTPEDAACVVAIEICDHLVMIGTQDPEADDDFFFSVQPDVTDIYFLLKDDPKDRFNFHTEIGMRKVYDAGVYLHVKQRQNVELVDNLSAMSVAEGVLLSSFSSASHDGLSFLEGCERDCLEFQEMAMAFMPVLADLRGQYRMAWADDLFPFMFIDTSYEG